MHTREATQTNKDIHGYSVMIPILLKSESERTNNTLKHKFSWKINHLIIPATQQDVNMTARFREKV